MDEKEVKGVLIFEGMKLGFLEGDFSISMDENGKMDSKAILSTSYNVLPIWLKIAFDNLKLSKEASRNIETDWCEDVVIQRKLLLAELTPSILVFVACGTALDSFYEQLKKHAKLNQGDFDTWKKKKTSRAAQISEVIRRVYKLDGRVSKSFKTSIKSFMKFRDRAVHPDYELKRACSRPDVPVGVDWKFAAYRYSNAHICYTKTMEMILFLSEKKALSTDVNKNMEKIIEVLIEFNLINRNLKQ